jgi:uncharacterized tellurite resistance protein B-like protein
MLEKLLSIFRGASQKPVAPAPSMELAVAALLVEAARADQSYEDREKHLIDSFLWAHFGLDALAAAALRAQAEDAQAAATDVHRFTRVVKAMAHDDKLRLVEGLWRIVLADGERDSHEDALIRRLCGLIYVSDVNSGDARRRAANALQSGGNPSN